MGGIRRWLNRATGGVPEAQAVYERGRDEGYARVGERHGYTGLAWGVAAVLASRGIVVEPLELTSRYHSELVGLADRTDRLTVQEIAREFDERTAMWGRSPLPRDVSDAHRFGYHESYGSVDVSWIAQEITAKLKKDKIRRGTKRYREFVLENGRRVADAVAEAVRRRAHRDAEERARWAARAVEEVRAVEAGLSRLGEARAILVALWGAAELPGEPRSLAGLDERAAAYAQAIATMRGSLEYASRPPTVDVDDVRRAMEHPEIRPFAEAAGAV